MHILFKMKAYEAEHGPHFNEEYAHKAVKKMENEDGSNGPHYSLEEAYRLASQYGINLGGKINKYDWFVALNMVYSDFYKAISTTCGSVNPKHFVEFAKAWLMDKDADEGKMWFYFIYIMKDEIREAEMDMYEEGCVEDEEESFKARRMGKYRYGSRMGRNHMGFNKYEEDDEWDDEEEYEPKYRRTRSVRYMRY